VVVIVDAVMTNLAGKFFGSTGTTMAQSVMALMMTNAVYGIAHLPIAIVLIYGHDYIPYEIVGMAAPWILLAWAGFMTTVVIGRAYDTAQVLSLSFGLGSAAVKGMVIYLALYVLTLR